jgi:hypothetical protein
METEHAQQKSNAKTAEQALFSPFLGINQAVLEG